MSYCHIKGNTIYLVKMSSYVLYIFHRDLRLPDHRGLERAAELAREKGASILPAFFFTPPQVSRNPVKSSPAIEFMIDSLSELQGDLQKAKTDLMVLYGSNKDCLSHVWKATEGCIVAIVDVRDYTPFAKQRITEYKEFATKNSIIYEDVSDLYLCEPGTVLNGSGKTFQKFTPFWNHVRTTEIPEPKQRIRGPWTSATTVRSIGRNTGIELTLAEAEAKFLTTRLGAAAAQIGGRSNALKRLKALPKEYDTTRDFPALPTSFLSAHNHFGTVSIREVYWASIRVYGSQGASDEQGFIRQLWWRDFNGHLMAAFESLYGVDPWEFEGPAAYKGKQGAKEREVFDKWTRGETGHELVDAGMKQLLTTGYIHNRVRMVCASWLVKDEGVWWRWGERWFAAHLVDYDPAQNLMNWIGISSLAPFGAAPFRRHDPERTQERFDKDRTYVEKFL